MTELIVKLFNNSVKIGIFLINLSYDKHFCFLCIPAIEGNSQKIPSEKA